MKSPGSHDIRNLRRWLPELNQTPLFRLVAHGSDCFQEEREKQSFELKQATGFSGKMYQISSQIIV